MDQTYLQREQEANEAVDQQSKCHGEQKLIILCTGFVYDRDHRRLHICYLQNDGADDRN